MNNRNKIPPRPGKDYKWDEWDEKWVVSMKVEYPDRNEIGFRNVATLHPSPVERTITVVAIDCSGSMNDEYLERAVKIANSLNSPNTVYVLFSTEVLMLGTQQTVSLKKIREHFLSGGTDFEELQRVLRAKPEVKQVIVLTDDHPAINDWVSMKRWAFIDVGISNKALFF